jgi:diguanylate cyclase (GGDEF)-like protein
MAEELRKGIEEHDFPLGETQPLGRVTASFGVAEYPIDAQSEKSLISSADHALYHSKETGRNRVSMFDKNILPKAQEDPEETPDEEDRQRQASG